MELEDCSESPHIIHNPENEVGGGIGAQVLTYAVRDASSSRVPQNLNPKSNGEASRFTITSKSICDDPHSLDVI